MAERRKCVALIFSRETNRTKQCGKPSGKFDLCDKHRSKDKSKPITNGKWSAWLPPRLIETYETLLQERDPFNLLPQFTFLHTLALTKLREMGDTAPIKSWWKVRNKLRFIINAELRKGPMDEELHDGLTDCVAMLEVIGDQIRAEAEVRQLIREMSEIVKVEVVRAERTKAYLTPEQAMAFVAALTTIILECIEQVDVHDANWKERFRERVAREFIRICTTSGVQAANAVEDRPEHPIPIPSAS